MWFNGRMNVDAPSGRNEESPLCGTLVNENGDTLACWPFRVLTADGSEITPAELAAAAGTAQPEPTAGEFITAPDGSYAISGAPGEASVRPIAPLAPIDTAGGPSDVAAGPPTTDGGRVSKIVGWIKSTASVVEKHASSFRAVVKDDAGEAVGFAELLGLRYRVKEYQAQVSDTLTRGSRLNAAGLSALASRGFRGVVNFCREYNDSAAVTEAGMNPLHIGVLDNTSPSYAEVKQFLDFVTEQVNQPAYCHCEAGVGRTGVFCAAYRIAVSGWSADDAIHEARKYGLALQSQVNFIQALGRDIAAGKIAGYPVSVSSSS